MSNIETLLSRLDKVRASGPDRWSARCPAHDDRGPSLAIRDDAGKILVHCFAGCEPLAVLNAVGLRFDDLFPEPLPPSKQNRRPFPAADVLDCVVEEARIVYLIAREMHGKRAISDDDFARLYLAVSRLDAAQDVVRG